MIQNEICMIYLHFDYKAGVCNYWESINELYPETGH